MSLLEDVFLEDEANEAQELERVIEGDEFDERPRSRSDSDDNSEREGEAEEEKKRVDPASTKTSRVIKNPRFILNPARLTGPRGIHVIPEHFKDFKFKGKGHEKEDLDLVLKKLEHWAYRLYPKFKFEDCLKKIETLGKKRPVMVNLHKIRTDQHLSEETVVQRDSSDDEGPQEGPQENPPEDEFDKLLQQQIVLARSTPAPGSVKKGVDGDGKEHRSLMMPKATSSPSISDEQRERILRSRKLAEERRLARQKAANINNIESIGNISSTPSKSDSLNYPKENNDSSNFNKNNSDINIENTPSQIAHINNSHEAISSSEYNNVTENVFNIEENDVRHVKNAIPNIIDSSDEDNIVSVNESIKADIHKDFNREKEDTIDKKSSGQKEHDDVLIEKIKDNNSMNVTGNDKLDKEYGTVTPLECKVDELENNVDIILESDANDKECGNYDEMNIDNEKDLQVIVSDNNTNIIGSSMNVEDMITCVKSNEVINNDQRIEGSQKDCIEVKQNQDVTSDVAVQQSSVNVVETNVDEIMDVDFDDEF